MKRCDYCGRENDDIATECRECGSTAFAGEASEKPVLEPRPPGPDEIPLAAFVEREGNVVILKCRSPGEAYLVSEELERADIVAPLPSDDELRSDYKQKGYVELRISARAYESVAELRTVVEFQYKRLRQEQPLSCAAKAVAIGCAFMIVPGLLVFIWLLSSYRTNGYGRMAKEFKFWFFIGLASWLLLVCSLAVLA